MSACLCPQCTTTPAFTYTEEYRMQCEARAVLRRRKPRRQWYLGEVQKARGQDAAVALLVEMMRQGGEDVVKNVA